MGRLGLLDEYTNGEDLVSYSIVSSLGMTMRGGRGEGGQKYGGAAGRKDHA